MASLQELAALEAEAEAQALQEQQRRSAPAPPRDGAHSHGSDSVSLHDNVSQAEHAMVSHCCACESRHLLQALGRREYARSKSCTLFSGLQSPLAPGLEGLRSVQLLRIGCSM